MKLTCLNISALVKLRAKFVAMLSKWTSDDSVLIYQYGKVGSTALNKSIPGSISTHDLYGFMPGKLGLRLTKGWWYVNCWIYVDRFIRRALIGRRKKIKIIVPLRDPASRNLSMYMQKLPYYYADYFRLYPDNALSEGDDLIKRIYLNTFCHEYCDLWFEHEFSRFTKINIDEIKLEKGQRYGVVEKGKYCCLFLDYKILREQSGISVVSEFLGSEFEMVSANSGDKKWYSEVYSRLRADEEFMRSVKSTVAKSKVALKFYEGLS